MRPDPGERVPLKLVRETDAGMIVRGKVGMHTSPVYAEDVYVGSHCGIDRGPHRATFTVPVAAPGVTVLCRKIAARHQNPFLSPLSSRFDELDGQMWLDDVFIPWERVFLMDVTPEPMASWLFSARSPWATRGGIASSGSVPTDVALTPSPRAAARRLKYSAAMRLLAEPCKQTKRTFPCWATMVSSAPFTRA